MEPEASLIATMLRIPLSRARVSGAMLELVRLGML
jgi:hypothetical protein